MKSFIIKFSLLIICFFSVYLFNTTKVYAAGLTVTGRVIMSGTNAPISGIWVMWTDGQGGYRYVLTDNSGNYLFDDLSIYPPGQLKKVVDNPIDTNMDGAIDSVEVFLNGGTIDQHFNSLSNSHSFTAIVPVGWSGSVNTVSGININSLDTSIIVPDIIFTPALVQATPTPAPIYTISGNIFVDANMNGIKDITESSYQAVTITLSGLASASTISDVNGNYSITNLLPGTYTVALTTPSGYVATTATSSKITLTADQDVDFGIVKNTGGGTPCTASITGVVFNDTNGDGILDTTETGLANWTISLTDPGLATPIVTTTDSAGNYSFSNLCKNTYTITQSIAPPWVTTTQLSYKVQVIDDTGNLYSGNDFGNHKIFTISGSVFTDTNSNKIIDAGETGMAGQTIFLSGDTFASVTTDANGMYSFPNLAPGTYRASLVMPSGYRSTTANSINIGLNNNTAINFGLTLSSTIKVKGQCNSNSADIYLVIDHSSSMTNPDPSTGNQKIDDAKAAASAFVDILSKNAPSSRIGLIQFSSHINYPNDPSRVGVLVPLTNNYAQLKTAISNIAIISGTCDECGIDLVNNAFQQSLGPNTQKVTIFLTDGIADQTINGGDPENMAMNKLIDGVNSQNIIYNMIGLGTGSEIDEPFLKQMAATNGGIYYNDPTNGTLLKIFTDLTSQTVATGEITGTVFNDLNINKIFDPGELPIPNMTIQLTGNSLLNTSTTTSDSNGNYAFNGLCENNIYTVREIPKSPWLLTTPGTIDINVIAGVSYPGNNFGNKFGYKITGSVFNDINKNLLKDLTEPTINGAVVAATNGTVTNNPNGTFSIEGLAPGAVTISYKPPLPPGFLMLYPINGPPPSFIAVVGPVCSIDPATGSVCDALGNIQNLNFATSNSWPWLQGIDSDLRFDYGFDDKIPAAPNPSCGGSYASVKDASATTPGIIYSGDSSYNFGMGQASINNWIGGSISYPEVYPMSIGTLHTSYSYLLTKAQRAGITPIDMTTLKGCSDLLNCSLPNGLKDGIYISNGSVTLNASSFQGNKNYIFLINGDLTIMGNITTNSGSTALFSASGNIIIDRSVKAAANSCYPQSQLQGIFSSDKNFTLDGRVLPGVFDCVLGVPDGMLNVEGTIIVNAARGGGKFINNRDLCGDNPAYPSFTVRARPDFILNAPTFLMDQTTISNEVAP